MKATKFLPGIALSAGLLVALVSAATDITYTDGSKVPAGSKPTGAVFTFVDPADPAAAPIAQAGYKAIDAIGQRLVSETTRELANRDTKDAVAVLHLKNFELPKPVAGQPKI